MYVFRDTSDSRWSSGPICVSGTLYSGQLRGPGILFLCSYL